MDKDTDYGVGFSWIFVPGPEPAGARSRSKQQRPAAGSRGTGRKGGAAFSKEAAGSCSTKAATAAGCAA